MVVVGLHEMMHIGHSPLGLAQSKRSLTISLRPKDGSDRMVEGARLCCDLLRTHSSTRGHGLGFSGGAWNCEWLSEGKMDGRLSGEGLRQTSFCLPRGKSAGCRRGGCWCSQKTGHIAVSV